MARGASVRMAHGPWEARYYAAYFVAQRWGYLPPNWDWAAQSLNIRAPPPLRLRILGPCVKKAPLSPFPLRKCAEIRIRTWM